MSSTIDYKKLYEESQLENKGLKEEIKELKEDMLVDTEIKELDYNNGDLFDMINAYTWEDDILDNEEDFNIEDFIEIVHQRLEELNNDYDLLVEERDDLQLQVEKYEEEEELRDERQELHNKLNEAKQEHIDLVSELNQLKSECDE